MGDSGDGSIERANARVGTTVDGKWHLDALLGTGGMAAVYAATHRNGTRAAIKVLNPDIALNADAKTRFLREGYVANKIGHSRVVLVQDDDEAPDGTVYLVMELLEGDTLQAVISEGKKTPPKEVLRIARDVLEVLAVAHEKEVIHRDLKPGNLLVARDGSVKLLDFGVAKVRESTAVGVPNVTTLSAMGTPGFMPPEQARGRWDNVDGRADIWALGATMFALLTCRYVHEEETPNEQLLAAMTKPAPKLADVMPDAPEAVASIVDQALAFDREERFSDAAAMKAAIDSALARLDRDSSFGSASLVDDSAPSDSSKSIATPVSAKAAPKTPVTAGATVADVRTRRGGRSARWLGLVAVLAVAFVALVALRNMNDAKPVDTHAASANIAATLEAPASAKPAAIDPPPQASVAPSTTEPAASASVASSSKIAAKPRPASPATTPTAKPAETAAAPATTPAPSASVDIFGKRH